MLATASGAETMSVQVRQGPVRGAPSFLGPVVANLAYGDRVSVQEKKPGWIKVSCAGGTGWMHELALTAKKVVMSAGGANVATGASGEDLALAGKGFNSDVEAQFKAQNRDIDFGPVDRMEKRKANQEEVAAFLKEGGVAGKGGAQ
jgi:uncharacterized protein YraI